MSVFEQRETPDGASFPAIDAGGEWRLLAAFPSLPSARLFCTPFSAANPVIPRGQWRKQKRSRKHIPILDQDGRGSCVGHGAATALMLAKDVAGHEFQLLSAPFVYAMINGGWDRGANLGPAADTLSETGVCLMTEFPEPKYLKRDIPAAAYETAKRFRASEIYSLSSWDELISAWILGFSVFDTIRCGLSFNSLSKDAVPPVSSGPGNHCIASGDELRESTTGELVLDKRNSWTAKWGDGGHFGMTERHVTAQGRWYEGYAIKVPSVDPLDPTNVPMP
jgi:hypothetical protein